MRKVLVTCFIFIFFFSYNCYSQWTLSGSNLYPTATTNNVGIGNTAPGMKLDITGDTRSTRFCSGVLTPLLADIFTYDSKSTYNYGISWVSDSWFAGGSTNWLSGWGGIKLFTSATPRLSITNSGNVGIGTVSPSSKLNVDPQGAGTILLGNSNTGSGNFTSLLMGISAQTSGYSYIQGTGSAGSSYGFMVFNPYGGNILIGKTTQSNAAYILDVNGATRANKVVVNTTGADFVFDSSYDLKPLDQVENYISKNKHLPDIAPAAEMQKEGLDLGDNQTKLLQKVEELTLYLIEQKKQLDEQNKKIEALQAKMATMRKKQLLINTD